MGMSSLTLAITKDLRKRMDEFPEINWSEVARNSIKQEISYLEKARFLKKMDRLLKNSKLTERDALRLGRKVNERVARRLLAE